MKKYILVLLITAAAIVPFFIFRNRYCPLTSPVIKKKGLTGRIELKAYQDNILKYLKLRKDELALAEAKKILSVKPDDTSALWAKAEILRRAYKFKESEELLKQVLAQCPDHGSSLITLSYIKYHDNKFSPALKILRQVLKQSDLERENEALVYLLMGSINAKRATQGGILSKLAYGVRIKGYFEKAKSLAPDLSEVRLGIGSFYLLAPRVAGGDIDKAIEELEYTVRLAPDFATANVRLAQAYKKKGDLEKYNFYLKRTKELDPQNPIFRDGSLTEAEPFP